MHHLLLLVKKDDNNYETRDNNEASDAYHESIIEIRKFENIWERNKAIAVVWCKQR